MSVATQGYSAPVSKTRLWTSRVLSAVPVFMLLFSATLKLLRLPSVMQGFVQFGFSEGLLVPLGIVELTCTVIYLVPRTAVLGAILLTGYLGGAVVTHLRAGQAIFFVPALAGVLLWAGLYLREPRLRALLPLRG